jgi:beta-lactamase class A
MQIDRRIASRPGPLRPRRQIRLSFPGLRFWLIVTGLSILSALVLTVVLFLLYTRSEDRLPGGLVVADIPVGGLTEEEATARLNEAYSVPLMLDYRGSAIRLDPAQVGFTVDVNAMLDQVPDKNTDLIGGFWNYLWAQTPPPPEPIVLKATYNQSLLQNFLADVASRYDEPGSPAQADPATLSFVPGSAGRALDREAAFTLIDTALYSSIERSVTLPVNDFAESPPTLDNLASLLYTDIRQHQFTGTVHIYVGDLQTGEALDIAMHNGEVFPVNDGIAFSGMSTIKIAVMTAFFRYQNEQPTADELLLLNGIFAESANAYTDLILGIIGARQAGGGLVGANMVSDTMAELGLPNTYIAGLLDTLGAITTPRNTPGNSRTDVDLNPDLYNQTSADDMGRLLVMIYECTEGRGMLIETFPNDFTPEECQLMIDLIATNEVGPIFVSGGSPGAEVIHKHGWDLIPLNNVADAAFVFSPKVNYVMTIYVHRDEPVPFDNANRLIVSLATAVSNYFSFK